MQNRLLIIFLTLLMNIFNQNNAVAVEQFTFDVSEIEILNNGNIFKGLNRGQITSDNGFTINADEFEYNRNSNVLNARGNVKIIIP